MNDLKDVWAWYMFSSEITVSLPKSFNKDNICEMALVWPGMDDFEDIA